MAASSWVEQLVNCSVQLAGMEMIKYILSLEM
jgi:hypothetical protein